MAEDTNSRSDLQWMNEIAKNTYGSGLNFFFFNKKELVDLDWAHLKKVGEKYEVLSIRVK